MPKPMPTIPDRLRVNALRTGAVEVDRENKVIRGYVVALEGAFRPDPMRGEFDRTALEMIHRLMAAAPNGLKSRFAHPTESGDGLGKFLGRAKNPRLDKATIQKDGKAVEVSAVRADLHLDPTSFETPNGNLGQYILDLAASDPEALSSSLVLQKKTELRRNPNGTPMTGPDGKELPALWRPTVLYASDIVDEGAAVDGLLSATGHKWTHEYLAKGESLLNELFAGQTRDVVSARCTAWLSRYLDTRYGESAMDEEIEITDELTEEDATALEAEGDAEQAEATPAPGTEILRKRLALKAKI